MADDVAAAGGTTGGTTDGGAAPGTDASASAAQADTSTDGAAGTTSSVAAPDAGASSSSNGAGGTEGAAATQWEAKDLRLPEGSAVDLAVVERIAATARAQGLSKAQAQAQVDLHDALKRDELGAVAAQVDAWTAETLADPAFGKTPDERKAAIEDAKRGLRWYAERYPDRAEKFNNFLHGSGLGSNPTAVHFLWAVGQATKEGTLGLPGGSNGPVPGSEEARMRKMFPTMFADSAA